MWSAAGNVMTDRDLILPADVPARARLREGGDANGSDAAGILAVS